MTINTIDYLLVVCTFLYLVSKPSAWSVSSVIIIQGCNHDMVGKKERGEVLSSQGWEEFLAKRPRFLAKVEATSHNPSSSYFLGLHGFELVNFLSRIFWMVPHWFSMNCSSSSSWVWPRSLPNQGRDLRCETLCLILPCHKFMDFLIMVLFSCPLSFLTMIWRNLPATFADLSTD